MLLFVNFFMTQQYRDDERILKVLKKIHVYVNFLRITDTYTCSVHVWDTMHYTVMMCDRVYGYIVKLYFLSSSSPSSRVFLEYCSTSQSKSKPRCGCWQTKTYRDQTPHRCIRSCLVSCKASGSSVLIVSTTNQVHMTTIIKQWKTSLKSANLVHAWNRETDG